MPRMDNYDRGAYTAFRKQSKDIPGLNSKVLFGNQYHENLSGELSRNTEQDSFHAPLHGISNDAYVHYCVRNDRYSNESKRVGQGISIESYIRNSLQESTAAPHALIEHQPKEVIAAIQTEVKELVPA